MKKTYNETITWAAKAFLLPEPGAVYTIAFVYGFSYEKVKKDILNLQKFAA